MATIADLLVKLGIDSSDFTNGIQKAGVDVTGLQRGMAGLAGVGGGILAGGLLAAGAGAVAFGAALFESTKEAMHSQDIQAQLQAVLKSTGGIAGITSQQVNDLALSMSGVTKYDDEAITSAESLLLTFTNIGQTAFPQATAVTLDMSQALGQDLQSSAIMVGKALQDPILGVTALRRVGVNFSDSQQDVIKSLVQTGDLEGAQALILKELQTEFGGSAEAAGKTFAGQLAILNTKFGNIKESIGNALLPILTQLAVTLNDYLSRPEVIAFIQQLAAQIATFASQAVASVPGIIAWLQAAFGWLMQNQGIIVAAVAVIGAAIIAFLVSVVVAAIAAAPVFLPILAVILVIAGAAYLLYQAWTTNFGGIQEKTAAVWAFLQPILATVIAWLQVNIPLALQTLSTFWTGTLLPAIQKVWAWLSSVLFPFFGALINLAVVILGNQLKLLAAIWTGVLWPAIQTAWTLLKQVSDWMHPFSDFLTSQLAKSFDFVSDAIKDVTGWISNLASQLANLSLPDWLTPGSPTPLEMGLRGIAGALQDVNRIDTTSGLGGFSPASGGRLAASSGPVQVFITSPGIIDEQDIARRLAPALDAHLSARGLI